MANARKRIQLIPNEAGFLQSDTEILSQFPPTYLQAAFETMTAQIGCYDSITVKLLMHCFLTLASPHGLEHVRRALYAMRHNRFPTMPWTVVTNAVLGLERLSNETAAAVTYRRLHLFRLRQKHEQNMARLKQQGYTDDAPTASYDDMVSEVLRASIGQGSQIFKMVGDRARIRRKIQKYCGQAKNWVKMAERFSSETVLVLLPSSDIFGVSNSR